MGHCKLVNYVRKVSNKVESVEAEHSHPAALLLALGHVDVSSDAKVVFATVQEHALDFDFSLFDYLEQISIEAVYKESTQFLDERLSDDNDVAVARELQ